MTKTYKDQQGNKYRKTSGGWEIMRKGIGWQAFESTAYVHVYSEEEDDAILVIEPTPQTEPPEVAEEKQVRKVREDELFVHIAVEVMKSVVSTEHGCRLSAGGVSEYAGICAEAMIDELKEKGRL